MNRACHILALVGVVWSGCGDDDSSNDNVNENQNNAHQTRCGDGVTEGNEECDDGESNSDTMADACRTDCTLPRCGDGIPDTEEECDQGSENSDSEPDTCRSDCTNPICGDGIVDAIAGETCDDKNVIAGDGCSPDCTIEICGNGYVDPEEVCDDGNTMDGDGCAADCASDETCGNGVVDTSVGEECDEGTANSSAPDASCRIDCMPRRCGDGIVDPSFGEVCDDGNTTPGDGCSTDCLSDETCGNGYVDAFIGEVCDDGNNYDDDGCSADCRSDETCGNGIADVYSVEQCDGTDLNGQSCTSLGFTGGTLSCRTNCLFDLLSCSGSPSGTLIFSEYVEGSSYDKALELFNFRVTGVSLANCHINAYTNGSSNVSATIALNPVYLLPHQPFIICHDSASTALTPYCDQLTYLLAFSGNDTLELVCDGATLDIFGRIGEDPGLFWGSGMLETRDHTLRRKCTITTGDIDGTDIFDPSLEWLGYAINSFDDLGAHCGL